MSNGDDEEAADEAPESDDASAGESTPDDPAAALDARLDEIDEELEAAETEADLDDVEAHLDEAAENVAAADLPEPDEDDDEAEDPRADLEDRIASLREELDAARGPYVEDVAEVVSEAGSTVADAEWTDDGAGEAVAAVDAFLSTADEHVDAPASAGGDVESAAAALDDAAASVRDSGLDADADAEAIADLLSAAETLTDDLEAAETWDDLTVREQLDANGFYDVLTNENRKDYPPEWTAIKIYAKRGEVEPILLALDKLDDSDFMEEYVYDQLIHLGSAAQPAFDEIHQRAQKRDKDPIRILGKIGDERAADTLHEFVEGDGDPALQKVTLRALGEIGSEDSTQPVANRLVAEDPEVRSVAARALGMIGDTRAIDPLSDILGVEEEHDTVRASAAWALRQIGTEEALDVAGEYVDDAAYLVQAEAEKAASA